MKAAITLEGVDKGYGLVNRFQALNQMSFRVPKGTICGLIGPNGAGKTTTFSIIAGFLLPDRGHVDILGEGPFDAYRLKGRLGVLPQDADLGLRQSPRAFLRHLGLLQGLSKQRAWNETERLLEELNLRDKGDVVTASLSHGMRRRVAAATALLGQPELVLLDEPMSGLDPEQVQSLRSFLAGLRGQSTVFISSHNLAELELLCDHVIIVDGGECLAEGPTHEIMGKGELAVWSLGPGEVPMEALKAQLFTHDFVLDGRELRHTAPPGETLDEASLLIASLLVKEGIAIRGMRRGQSLERSFLERSTSSPR